MSINPQNCSLALSLWHLILCCVFTPKGCGLLLSPSPSTNQPSLLTCLNWILSLLLGGKLQKIPVLAGKMHKWPVSNSAKQSQLPSGPDMQIPLLYKQPQHSQPAQGICSHHFQEDYGHHTEQGNTQNHSNTQIKFPLYLHILPQMNIWGKSLPPFGKCLQGHGQRWAAALQVLAGPGSRSPALGGCIFCSQGSWKASRPWNIELVTDRVLQFTSNNVKEVPHTRSSVSAHIQLFALILHFHCNSFAGGAAFFFSFGVKAASATTECWGFYHKIMY